MANRISTNLEQSKHLLELGLDPKTADMFWRYSASLGNTDINGKIAVSYHDNLFVGKYDGAIPAWSVSALLDVMPEFYPELHLYRDGDWYCRCDQVESEYCDDPIIAVYDVVCWLLDHNAIKNIHEHE